MKKLALLSIFGIFFTTIVSLLLANKIERFFPEIRSFIAVITAFIFSGILYFLISILFKHFKITNNLFKNGIKDLAYGLIIGSLALVFSVLILLVSNKHSIFVNVPEMNLIMDQVLFQLRPALIEEIGFRLGMVTITLYFFGKKWALVVGSLPFGVLHLLNFVSGQEIIWEYILGTSIAGLFLTLIYFNFQILSAIGCHYIWNVLASVISEHSTFKQHELEGGSGTLIVLIVFSVYLYFRSKKADLFLVKLKT